MSAAEAAWARADTSATQKAKRRAIEKNIVKISSGSISGALDGEYKSVFARSEWPQQGRKPC
jgi:hypothetical protein